jgi:hypothetical protein
VDVVDREVLLSSDNQFHCLSIVLFYNVKAPQTPQ